MTTLFSDSVHADELLKKLKAKPPTFSFAARHKWCAYQAELWNNKKGTAMWPRLCHYYVVIFILPQLTIFRLFPEARAKLIKEDRVLRVLDFIFSKKFYYIVMGTWLASIVFRLLITIA